VTGAVDGRAVAYQREQAVVCGYAHGACGHIGGALQIDLAVGPWGLFNIDDD
jgi:hypothetical protein